MTSKITSFLDYNPHFCRDFLDISSEALFASLRQEIKWRNDEINIFGKVHPIPRLHAWYGDPGADYCYSRIPLPRNDWSPQLIKVKEAVEEATGRHFNGALLNLYRDGRDSNGWHCDDEPELISPVVVAGLSLGAQRPLHFRRIGDSKMCHKILLEDGSLMVMKEGFQERWQHCIAKKAQSLTRINLTFRRVKLSIPSS